MSLTSRVQRLWDRFEPRCPTCEPDYRRPEHREMLSRVNDVSTDELVERLRSCVREAGGRIECPDCHRM